MPSASRRPTRYTGRMTSPSIDSHLTGYSSPVAPGITAAFGACCAMLATAYVLHFPGLSLPGGVVGLAMLAAAAVALVTLLGPSGRASVVKAGLLAGALLGLVSLVAMGAYFAELSQKDELPALGQLIAMCSGWITFTSLFGLVAGLVSRRTASDAPRAASDWLPRMGGIALVATLMVLAAGGVVTAAEAGMAVPDWPGTFGANMFLYPLSKMTGGVYFEHAHRLLGAFTGLSTIAFLLLAVLYGRTRLLKVLSVVAFVHVSLQGYAGGMRVEADSQVLAMLHGISAIVFFAFLAVLTLMSTRSWSEAPKAKASVGLAIGALVVLFIQIVFGAVARHFPDSLHGVMTHAGFSLVAAGVITAAGAKSSRHENPLLARLGKSCVHTVGLQMLLGVAALGVFFMTRSAETPPAYDLAVTTTHQVIGALLFSLTALLAVWSVRLSRA